MKFLIYGSDHQTQSSVPRFWADLPATRGLEHTNIILATIRKLHWKLRSYTTILRTFTENSCSRKTAIMVNSRWLTIYRNSTDYCHVALHYSKNGKQKQNAITIWHIQFSTLHQPSRPIKNRSGPHTIWPLLIRSNGITPRVRSSLPAPTTPSADPRRIF